MNVVHEDVKQCVENELQHAVSVFGLHHSWHEKAAVVGEELEECCEEMENLVDSMKFAWKQTRGNETDYIKEQAYNGVYDAAVRLAIEAIQVAAMAKKPVAEQAQDARWQISSDGYYPYCPICGARPGRKTKFCAECGAKLGE